tara:strand:+ start:617 stop:862 length:246 start_codon:yes stop_codon:yes gene_type:complete
MAKEFLTEKKAKFKDIDVSENPKKADEMIKISGQMGVPVIVSGKTVIVGFDRPKLEEIVKGQKKSPKKAAKKTKKSKKKKK